MSCTSHRNQRMTCGVLIGAHMTSNTLPSQKQNACGNILKRAMRRPPSFSARSLKFNVSMRWDYLLAFLYVLIHTTGAVCAIIQLHIISRQSPHIVHEDRVNSKKNHLDCYHSTPPNMQGMLRRCFLELISSVDSYSGAHRTSR